MEAVCVLGHYRDQVAGRFEVGERVVAGVGSGGDRNASALAGDRPVSRRIAEERIDRGDLDRVVLGPQPTSSAKRGYAAFGGNAGPRKRNAVASSREKLGGTLHCHVSVS